MKKIRCGQDAYDCMDKNRHRFASFEENGNQIDAAIDGGAGWFHFKKDETFSEPRAAYFTGLFRAFKLLVVLMVLSVASYGLWQYLVI